MGVRHVRLKINNNVANFGNVPPKPRRAQHIRVSHRRAVRYTPYVAFKNVLPTGWLCDTLLLWADLTQH